MAETERSDYDIPYYLDFLSPEILEHVDAAGVPVPGVPGLRVAPGLRREFPEIETADALAYTCELYRGVREQLAAVLAQRNTDRAFIDSVTLECTRRNVDRDFLSPDYETVIGRRDELGRIVVGPATGDASTALAPDGSAHGGAGENQKRQSDPGVQSDPSDPDVEPIDVPDFMTGEQVTLFGPPDTAKMSINAMNSLHRRLPDEPEIVARLVEASGDVPRWGADNEDSKTPIMSAFLRACENLIGCFEGTLRFEDTERDKTYALADEGLARPIKRIPGLALPDGNHLLDGNPLPLHLTDLALHIFHNWNRPEALVFYVPKLENEEEAAYLKALIGLAERRIKARHPEYELGTVRLFVVFESPRAIFRIREMATTLAPHFIGGSLGWHDFLASTARLFRHDPSYRIPVKADPNIVINHIKESHLILVDALAPFGAIAIGGMYGVLYEGGNAASFQVSLAGFVKDVVTQLKRGLDGFWVAHPDFVRLGIAIVEAWRRFDADPESDDLETLIRALITDEAERDALLEFVRGDDVPGLDPDDPLYPRAVLAADIEGSDVIANDDPEEVRYNVFQAIQYLTDWLSGNGCVALPATMTNARGETVFVRVMDDLATTERSRWEVWAEIQHGRVSHETFEQILAEELEFIRAGEDTETKRVQVAWSGEAARWYPIAEKILRQLVTDPDPVEFVTELLMPFTLDFVRESDDPWQLVTAMSPGKYREEA